MRRNDREITELAEKLAILDRCEVMRLGLCDGGKPYIVPMNFAYEIVGDNVFIYFHCASKGRKLDIIAKNDSICFEADCSYRTLESKKACEWSAEFQSVIGEGSISIITEDSIKARALDLIMKRYGFIGKPEYDLNALAAVTVLRADITSMTGKQHIIKT